MRDFRDAKSMAHTLRDQLAARQFPLTHSECLELVAKLFGLDDWNTLSARIEAGRAGPGAKPSPGADKPIRLKVDGIDVAIEPVGAGNPNGRRITIRKGDRLTTAEFAGTVLPDVAAAELTEAAKTKIYDVLQQSGTTLYCSFCGKSQHVVAKLIAGPTAFICDKCVAHCDDIIEEEDIGALLEAMADPKAIEETIDAKSTEALLGLQRHVAAVSASSTSQIERAHLIQGGRLTGETALPAAATPFEEQLNTSLAAKTADELQTHIATLERKRDSLQEIATRIGAKLEQRAVQAN